MLIRDMAIRGSTDCLGPIDINWKACGRYIFVLIEEYTGKWWYRIFLSDEKFQYEKNRILYPAEEDDDLMYIYGYYENMNGTERELQMLKNGDWPYRIRVLAQKELCEEQNGICMRTAAEIWSDVLSYVKAHYHITDVVYKTWLEPLSISSFQNDGAITIMVPAEPPHAYEYVRRKLCVK